MKKSCYDLVKAAEASSCRMAKVTALYAAHQVRDSGTMLARKQTYDKAQQP